VEVTIAALCDAATVREGLLHVLGGGVGIVHLASYPGPIPVTLAIRVEIETGEANDDHTLEVRVVGLEPETEVGRVSGAMHTTPPENGWDLESPVQVVTALPLGGFQLPAAGKYEVRISIDGQMLRRVRFKAAEEALPGLTPQNIFVPAEATE
jgi:hypothetical protein